MMELLQDLPDNVVGFVGSGHISAADYEAILIPAFTIALEKHDKLRVLYQLQNDFTGLTPGAVWDDIKLGFGHLRAWEKVAIVTDVSWVAQAASLFRFLMPCPVQLFALSDIVKAREWITA